MACFSVEGEIIWVNEAFLELVSYREEEIIGQHHSIFVPYSFKRKKEYQCFWERLKDGEKISSEFKRITKNEKDIWIRGSYIPIKDSDGEVHRIVKIAFDITREKERWISDSQKLLALDKSNATVELSLDGKIIKANKNFLDLIGYEFDELEGQDHSVLVPPEEVESRIYKELWKSLRAGEFFSGEFRRISKSGNEVWIRGTYNPIFDINGNIDRIEKFAVDITQQKIASTMQEEQMKAIYRSTAIIEFDTNGVILDVNQPFLDLLCYGRNEVVGEHHSIFVSDEELVSEEYNQLWQGLRDGEFKIGEFRRYTKFGKKVWIRGAYNPVMDVNGKIYKVMKFAFDVTAVKEAEQIMYEKKEREALSSLIHTYNHEINNPLTVASIMVCKGKWQNKKDREKMDQSLQRIHKIVKQIENVVEKKIEFEAYAGKSKMLKLKKSG